MGRESEYPADKWERVTEEVRRIQGEVASLRRAMEGDQREGWTGLQDRVRHLEGELDVLSKELERMTWRYNALTTTVKWLGPSGVMLIIAFIGYVWQSGGVTP